MKQCLTCGTEKPESDFWALARRPDGLDLHCAPCRKARRWTAGGHVPSRPLSEMIRGSVPHGERTRFCESLGISARSELRWWTGEYRSVRFLVADRVLTRAGWLWFDVWGDDPVARRVFDGASS